MNDRWWQNLIRYARLRGALDDWPHISNWRWKQYRAARKRAR